MSKTPRSIAIGVFVLDALSSIGVVNFRYRNFEQIGVLGLVADS